MITSKKVLFNAKANFFLIIALIATTPPNALIGSHVIEFSKDLISFFSIETPQGLACLIIAVTEFSLKEDKISNAE